MCAPHWRLVPMELRGPVYSTWNNGKGYGTQEHLEAMGAAIHGVELHLLKRYAS